MGIVGTIEVASGRGVSGKYRETFTYTRTFMVRLDDPQTSMVVVSNAPGVSYLDGHPDDPACVAQEFDCQAVDETGLYYKVVVRYFVPSVEQQNQQNPTPGELPADVWSAGGSVTTGPCTRDKDDKPIVNAAKDPIDGLEREYVEWRLTLTRAYPDIGWTEKANKYSNTVNSSAWSGGEPRSWKCQFNSASKRTENSDGVTLTYWEVVWEFVWNRTTWDLKPENIGTMELKDGKKKVIQADGQPVTQPVALTDTGEAAAAGTDPTVINDGKGVRVYDEEDFDYFGTIN